MKIGIIRETRTPLDRRVAISPQSAAKILKEHGNEIALYLEKSEGRVFKPSDYDYLGVEVNKEDMSDCDVLFGVREVNIDALIPNKHYFFFGHIAKMQPYNKPLLQAMMDKRITFTDYEYLVDDEGKRVCNFGWYAGVVGAYNTLRLVAIRNRIDDFGNLHGIYGIDKLLGVKDKLKSIKNKILVTGNGKASLGVQIVLRFIGYKEVPLNSKELESGLCYSVANTSDLVERKDGSKYNRDDFHKHPEKYVSKFDKYAEKYDTLIAAHKWEKGQPIYLSENTLRSGNNKIKVVGDITCDIEGSVRTTIHTSTHKKPFYAVKMSDDGRIVECSFRKGIGVMAVDNLPNAIPIDASAGFSTELEDVITNHLLTNGCEDEMIKRATILKNGKITERFSYLEDFIKS